MLLGRSLSLLRSQTATAASVSLYRSAAASVPRGNLPSSLVGLWSAGGKPQGGLLLGTQTWTGFSCTRAYSTDPNKQANQEGTRFQRALDSLKRLPQATKTAFLSYIKGLFSFSKDSYSAIVLLGKEKSGVELNRRDVVFLRRHAKDVKAFVPFLVIIALPFTPLLIPIYIQMFPHMLPSQFVDPTVKGEIFTLMYKSKDTATNDLKEHLRSVNSSMSKSPLHLSHVSLHSKFYEFMKKVEGSQDVKPLDLVEYAPLFESDFSLQNLSEENLKKFCQFYSVSKNGSRDSVKTRLDETIHFIRKDDQMIMKEGVDSLNEHELEEACFLRGFCQLDLTPEAHRRLLAEWIQLASVPQLSDAFYGFASVLMFCSHHNTARIAREASKSA